MHDTTSRPHITVVGDMILDRYLIGDATKLNPEQPGVVIHVDREEDRLGGAAAVAMIAAGLGAHVTLAGVIGRDEPGDRLRRLIDAHGIEPHLWIDDRPTTWKQRIVTRGQLRPDRCDREVTTPINRGAEQFVSAVPLGEILLVADYGKGVSTRDLLAALGGRARNAGVPMLIDPAQSRDWSEYGQVTLIKANKPEASEAVGNIRTCPLGLARTLADQNRCHVIITFDRNGIVCAERQRRVWYVPAMPSAVRDVCGAGDTVLATLGIAIAQGRSLLDACRLSVETAARQVTQIGVSGVTFLPQNVRSNTCAAPEKLQDRRGWSAASSFEQETRE